MVVKRASVFAFAALIVAVAPSERSAALSRYPRRPAHDSIYFPDDFGGISGRIGPDTESTTPTEIPLDFILRLNEIENVTDLFKDFIEDTPQTFGLDAGDILGNRFGEVERKAVTNPKPAGCIPEKRTVPLTAELSSDPTLFYYPTCTRVERCGGCCSHTLLSCQPTVTEIINFQVVVTQYSGDNKLHFVGKEIVPIEQHVKCKCDCITKKKDCNEFQDYRDKECRCVCINVDDEEKCYSENNTKLWDPNTCTCGCREVKDCSTGYFHDEKTCSCMPVPITRRRASERFGDQYDTKRDLVGRFDYKLVPGVVPLSTEDTSTKRKSWHYYD